MKDFQNENLKESKIENIYNFKTKSFSRFQLKKHNEQQFMFVKKGFSKVDDNLKFGQKYNQRNSFGKKGKNLIKSKSQSQMPFTYSDNSFKKINEDLIKLRNTITVKKNKMK